MQANWWQATGRASSLTKIMEARQNRIISKTVSRHKEMKEQLQFEGLNDTSQKHNPEQTKVHWATASRKGKLFLVIRGTFQQCVWKGWWQKSFTSLPQQQGGWLQINQEIKGSHPLGNTKEGIICQKSLVPKSFLTGLCLGVIAIQILGVRKNAAEENRSVREGASPPPKALASPETTGWAAELQAAKLKCLNNIWISVWL